MKYVDIAAVIQVIGSIYKNPILLENENYFFNEDDFTEEFHKILFGSIYNLHALGAKEISVNTVIVPFKKKDEDAYFLVWTTTLWNLLSKDF